MITVKAEKYRDALKEAAYEGIRQKYTDLDGLTRVEYLSSSSESDYGTGGYRRFSEDNGKTWGEWEPLPKQEAEPEKYGPHERSFPYNPSYEYKNSALNHYVGIGLERIYINGHEYAMSHIWNYSGPSTLSDHSYLRVRRPDGSVFYQLITYEEGAEFNPEDPMNEDYLWKNNSYSGCNIIVEDNGDLLIPMGVPVRKCCRMAGLDVNEVFPSRPDSLRGLIVIRAKWNGEKYDFIPGRPVVISDLQSSRGVDEPTIAKLKSGRILVVFRGAYYINPKWNTRIEPGTPGFKWYTYSDDGGKTFTPAMPWHFDDGEVIYSSASISHFFRDPRTDKLYWIGNITGHVTNEGWPRWPLQIVEVDETYGTAKKESLTVIDTRREGESDRVQLSNFYYFQNRENGHLEMFLTKFSQFPGEPWQRGEVWHYDITLPE